MREDDGQHRATEFIKGLYAADSIDDAELDTGVARLLAAWAEAELAAVMRSLPAPVALARSDQAANQAAGGPHRAAAPCRAMADRQADPRERQPWQTRCAPGTASGRPPP